MPNIIKLKGSEFTAPTDLANANTAFDSTVVKAYHTSALTVTVRPRKAGAIATRAAGDPARCNACRRTRMMLAQRRL